MNIARAGGNVASLLSSTTLASTYAEIPHGVSQTSFVVMAAVSSLVGYNFGTWIGSNQKRRAIISLIICLTIPVAYLIWDAIIDRGAGGIWVAVQLYLLFTVIFLAIFTAFGILQVNIFKGT